MKRVVALAAAFVAAGAAIVLLLLAIDVRREDRKLVRDDATYRSDPARSHLWDSNAVLPGDPARGLLGLDDQVAYRQAVQLFVLGRPRINVLEATGDMQTYRSIAAVELWRRSRSDSDVARRSRELNMLGILDLVSAGPEDRVRRLSALVRASGSFRSAVLADERNADAKYNLELSLRLIRTISETTHSLKGLGGAATQPRDFGAGY